MQLFRAIRRSTLDGFEGYSREITALKKKEERNKLLCYLPLASGNLDPAR
jgi:hypothetical protein